MLLRTVSLCSHAVGRKFQIASHLRHYMPPLLRSKFRKWDTLCITRIMEDPLHLDIHT
jgi:hypothetical protein